MNPRYVEVNRDMNNGFIISFNTRDQPGYQVVNHVIYCDMITIMHNQLMADWILRGNKPEF